MYICLYHIVSSVLPTFALCLCLQAKHITTSALASAMEDPATPVLLLDARMKEEVLFTAKQRSSLQHTAALCNTLQHTAPHCTTLHYTATNYVAGRSNKRGGVTHYNTL